MRRRAATLGLLALALGARAQTAPSASEVAAYDGLHAAAWRGDLARIDALAAQVRLNPRDPHGRTPVHVAAFARQQIGRAHV